MKELLLTSTIPYWIVFILVAAAGVLEFINMRKEPVPKSAIIQTTIVALAGTILVIAIYFTVGGQSVWWCTSSEYGFFSKLLRAVPMLIFIIIQLAQVFVYKCLVEQYYKRDLSIKGSFYSLIVMIPVALVVYLILGAFGMEETKRNTVFYIILAIFIVIGVGWAMTKNVMSVGMKGGMLFTAVTVVMIIGGVFSLFLLLTVILSLFLQIVMLAIPVVAVLYLFKSDIIGKNAPEPTGPRFRDNDGTMHYTASDRDSSNKRIAERKAQENK